MKEVQERNTFSGTLPDVGDALKPAAIVGSNEYDNCPLRIRKRNATIFIGQKQAIVFSRILQHTLAPPAKPLDRVSGFLYLGIVVFRFPLSKPA